MEGSYNARCPAVKRLLKEAQELHEATEEYYAHPIEDNLFEWHFTVRGPPETEFEGGVYHGRIIMPAEYPMKPPNIIFFTPNGRFETNKKICLSISGHHPETWQPSWSIRTALLAIIGFMPTPANGTIGALDYTAAERAVLSKKSIDYMCPNCGRVGDLLKERTGSNAALQQEAKEVSAQMVVTAKKEDFPEFEDKEVGEGEGAGAGVKAAEAVTRRNRSHCDPEPKESASLHKSEERPPSSDQSRAQQQQQQATSSSSSSQESSASAAYSSQAPAPLQRNSSPPQSSVALIANNLLLSAAVFVLTALVLRRLFLLEGGASDEMADILL